MVNFAVESFELFIYDSYDVQIHTKGISLPCEFDRHSYFRGRNFRGQKLSHFSRFLVIFAKVSAFGNSKSSKRESFFTRNHGYFSKRESFFTIKNIIKTGQFSKVMIYFYFNQVNYNNTWCFFFFEAASLNLYILYIFDYGKDLRCDLTNKFFSWTLPIRESFFTRIRALF